MKGKQLARVLARIAITGAAKRGAACVCGHAGHGENNDHKVQCRTSLGFVLGSFRWRWASAAATEPTNRAQTKGQKGAPGGVGGQQNGQ